MIGYSDGGGFAAGVGPKGVERGFIGTFAQAVDSHVLPLKSASSGGIENGGVDTNGMERMEDAVAMDVGRMAVDG